MSPTPESDEKPKPKFKACLSVQNHQSPTNHRQQQHAQHAQALVKEAILHAVNVVNNNNNSNNNHGADNNHIVGHGQLELIINNGDGDGIGIGDDNGIGMGEEEDDRKYFALMPPGYRFNPSDEELVVYYLMKKVANEVLPRNKIRDVELYHYNPGTLAETYPSEDEWYFFTPRERKYKNGNRPNRAAGDGYWKATGADKQIFHKGEIVGLRKVLVFYKGKPPIGDKTKWIMHEFRVQTKEAPKTRNGTDHDMRLDRWVLCKVYQKNKKAKGHPDGNGDGNEDPRTSSSATPSAPSTPFGNNANAVPGMPLINYNTSTIGGSSRFMAHPFGNNYAQMPVAPQYSALVPAETPQYITGPLVPNYANYNPHHHHQLATRLNYVNPSSSGNPLPLPFLDPTENIQYMEEATWYLKPENGFNSTSFCDAQFEPYNETEFCSDDIFHEDASYPSTQDPYYLPPDHNEPSSFMPKKEDDPSSF